MQADQSKITHSKTGLEQGEPTNFLSFFPNDRPNKPFVDISSQGKASLRALKPVMKYYDRLSIIPMARSQCNLLAMLFLVLRSNAEATVIVHMTLRCTIPKPEGVRYPCVDLIIPPNIISLFTAAFASGFKSLHRPRIPPYLQSRHFSGKPLSTRLGQASTPSTPQTLKSHIPRKLKTSLFNPWTFKPTNSRT